MTPNEAQNPTIEYVDPPRRIEVPARPIVTERPEPARLNRTQRRQLQRTAVRKARREARKAAQRENRAIKELRGPRCGRCHKLFIGRAAWRCQCKVTRASKERAEGTGNVTV